MHLKMYLAILGLVLKTLLAMNVTAKTLAVRYMKIDAATDAVIAMRLNQSASGIGNKQQHAYF
ncbi:hypothetical protein [Limosilactobacillus reuteri]|uniref:hypothetical protein n=1 Tax=Limosilactobacillus reuteri TaxID=1598 RepID=UPI001E2F2EA0|nr:hypothetical protein [Limosilactobacillus reuteri]MCC4485931.1 hypothetical protein [Limosilactobacillus reuteri]